jgi:hypothetical protein
LTFTGVWVRIPGGDKMKTVKFMEIDGHNRVLAVERRLADPEGTMRAIAAALNIPSENDLLARPDFEQLVEQYAVYPEASTEEVVYEDDDAAVVDLETKLKILEDRQILDLAGEIIPDLRGTKYHIKTGDVWAEGEITAIGIAVPAGAVLPEDLTGGQRNEIAAQTEEARIAGLSPEERAAEKLARLDALADEADHLGRRAAIQGNTFDAASWYQEHKTPIEEKYAS